MPAWFVVTVEVAEGAADDVAALLLDGGAAGAEVRDRSLAPMPGLPPLPSGLARVVAYYEQRADAEAAAGGYPGATVETIADRDWGEAWKQGLDAFVVGRVFVRPSWIAAAPPEATVEVVLDPGMAFGTGTHPTTAMCLAAVDALLASRPGATVLDVGTGSGLLAIAARKLGAGRTVGTENDPVALRVAAENAERNGVEVELRLDAPDALSGSFDIVVANILANILVELAGAVAARTAPGGTVLLSGLVAGQEQQVRGAYIAQGLVPLPALDRSDGEWRLVALQRPA